MTLDDGTVLPEVRVDYPIGHRRRRAEGFPLLAAEFCTNLARRFAAPRQAAILDLSLDDRRLAATPVPACVDAYIP